MAAAKGLSCGRASFRPVLAHRLRDQRPRRGEMPALAPDRSTLRQNSGGSTGRPAAPHLHRVFEKQRRSAFPISTPKVAIPLPASFSRSA
jgi:hypothetical protein